MSLEANGNPDTDTRGEMPGEDPDPKGRRPLRTDRAWRDAATAKDHLGPLGAGKGKEGPSPRSFRERGPVYTSLSDFRPPEL